MATNNLYLYKTTYELTMFENGLRMEGPMYNNTIKIHKGIDDKITFNVYDENRRLASISHLTLAVNLIDANTGALVLTKVPVIRDDVKGTLDVTFSWGDTANIDAGLYEFSITTTDTAGETSFIKHFDQLFNRQMLKKSVDSTDGAQLHSSSSHSSYRGTVFSAIWPGG